MASPMADDFQPPLVKRVRAESESPRKASAKAEDNIANSLNSSHHLSSMQAPFVGQSSWYAQPSSEAGTDDAADSGFSDGATPPASCEDSQESFSISAVPQAAASSSTSSSASVSGMATRSHSLSETLGDSAFVLDVEDGDEEEDDDQVSVISGLSNLSGSEWKPMAGPFSWVQRQMISGADPRALLQNMISGSSMIPEDMDQLTLWRIILNMLCDVPRRSKLDHVNTLDDVVGLIRSSKRIIVLTGAGVSVSCGIPDFRSRNGIYARLAVDFPDLPDPQAMFDIEFFKRNPKPFFKFAHEIYPGQFQPSPCHKFIRCLETHGTLLRNYTQNIDTLEQVVGLTRIVQCHGSFATATCMKCKFKVHSDDIKDSILKEKVPYCPKCVAPDISGQPDSDALHLNNSSGDLPPILKPDIVFFGESLGDEFHQSVAHDKNEADLLIMIGSSLKVRPVSLIPSSVDPKVPQVLINREPLLNISPDVELLGDCDGIINEICLRLGAGWEEPVHSRALSEISELPALSEAALAPSSEGASEASNYVRISLAKRLPDRSFYFSPPNRYIFPGAEVFEEQHQLDSDDDHIESPATDAEDDDDDDSVIPNTDTPTGRNFTPGSAAASESS